MGFLSNLFGSKENESNAEVMKAFKLIARISSSRLQFILRRRASRP